MEPVFDNKAKNRLEGLKLVQLKVCSTNLTQISASGD